MNKERGLTELLFSTRIKRTLAILLGYIYNTTARYIVFGDGLIAGLTHYVLPIIASSLLVGLNKEIIIQISIIVYFIAICMGPITNLKDIKEDRKRGYKTLVNTVKNPFTVAIILFEIQFFFILILYFFFNLSYINLILLFPIYILKIFITTKIYQQKSKEALNYLRLYLILSFTFLILSLTNNLYIIMQNLIILILYLTTIIYNEIK